MNMPTQIDIRTILPQEYPFLLIDKITDYEPGKRLVAVKNITGNEWAMSGQASQGAAISHFPETLLIETAAQAGIVLHQISFSQGEPSRRQFFLGKTQATFFKTAKEGDRLVVTVTSGKMMISGGYLSAVICVGDVKVAEMEIFYSVRQQ